MLEENFSKWSSRKKRSQRELWAGPEWREFHRNRRGRAFTFRRQPSQLIVVVAHIAAAIGYLILIGVLSSQSPLRSLVLGALLITPSLFLLSNMGSRITWSWRQAGRVVAGAALIILGVALLGEFLDETIEWWTVSDPQQNWIILWATAAFAGTLAALGVRVVFDMGQLRAAARSLERVRPVAGYICILGGSIPLFFAANTLWEIAFAPNSSYWRMVNEPFVIEHPFRSGWRGPSDLLLRELTLFGGIGGAVLFLIGINLWRPSLATWALGILGWVAALYVW